MGFLEGIVGFVFPDILHLDYVQREKGWGITQLYVELGLYHDQVQRYQRIFCYDQVLVLLGSRELEILLDRPLPELQGSW